MTQFSLSIRAFCVIVAAVAAFSLVAGCGGSNSSEAGTDSGGITVETGSLTKAQFIKKADAICKEGTTEWEKGLGAFIKQQKTGSQSEQVAELVETVYLPIFEKEIARVSSLGAPLEDRAQVAAILSAMQRALDKGVEKPKEFAVGQAPFGEATKLAATYGFANCGKP